MFKISLTLELKPLHINWEFLTRAGILTSIAADIIVIGTFIANHLTK